MSNTPYAFRPLVHWILPPVPGVRFVSQGNGGLDIEFEPGREREVAAFLKQYLDHFLAQSLMHPIPVNPAPPPTTGAAPPYGVFSIPSSPPTVSAPPIPTLPLAQGVVSADGSVLVGAPTAPAGSCDACAWAKTHPTTRCAVHMPPVDSPSTAAAENPPPGVSVLSVSPPGITEEPKCPFGCGAPIHNYVCTSSPPLPPDSPPTST